MAALVRDTPDDAKPLVVAYLRAAVAVVDVMEVTPDVLDGGRMRESGSLITDGDGYCEKIWRATSPSTICRWVSTFSQASLLAGSFRRGVRGGCDHRAPAVLADWSRPGEGAAGATVAARMDARQR